VFNTNVKIEKGTLLLSEPFMKDSFFKRTVVLITEYGAEGAVGFIMNKPINVQLSEVLPDAEGTADFPLYFGGPVQRDNLFYVHTAGSSIDNSIEIADGLYWGGDFNQVKELLKRGEIKNTEIKFFIGYSGWSEGQLEDEIKEKSWIVSKVMKEHFKYKTAAYLWRAVLRSMGKKYAELANYPEDPSLN
jgi:putative transcriptional regulator